MSSPSFVLVPSVYKAGTLYTEVPFDGTGDMVVARATTPTPNLSTRVNESGFIELVADNVPRLDYLQPDGSIGCPALLVEPSAQNLALQSEAFDSVQYTLIRLNAFGSGSVANTTATKDPFNGNNADYLQEDSTASSTHLALQINAGQVGGINFTFSVFAKAAERTRLNLFNNAGGGGNASFDLTAGTATLLAGVSASIQNYGNGWYRCILTYTPSVSGNFNVQVQLADASGNPTYNGTGNSGIYVFGAQVETGSIATSYIPTTTQAITRNADVINKTGVSGLIGQTEGVLYAEFIPPSGYPGRIFAIDDGTLNNRIAINRATSTRLEVIVRSSGSVVNGTIGSSAATAFNPDAPNKVAYAYKSGDFALAINGSVVASGTTTFAFTSALNNLATSESLLGAIFIDRIRATVLYTTRLPNYLLESETSQIQSYSALASSLSYTVV
jgi:hypothetical protein